MPVRVIVGCQWGDEGKGKVVDYFSEDADVVVRFQGGANAGHTVITESGDFVLHLLPSGILRAEKKCVIADGIVIDPEQLIKEIIFLRDMGVSVKGRLFISGKAHLVFPYHKYYDKYLEKLRKGKAIGTTGRGIGPAYTDRVARCGIRAYDLFDEELLKAKLDDNLKLKRSLSPDLNQVEEFGLKYNFDWINRFKEGMMDFIKDTSKILQNALVSGDSVLFEGAQGMMLDVDYGTYPYTTSSNTVSGGIPVNCGLAPFIPDETIGIVKAYTTRVGEGPFPTELNDEMGDILRKRGREFGATTGRPRRCGWLDFVALKYALKINGVNSIAMTKIDVLDGIERILICDGYRYKGKLIREFPNNINIIEECKPHYIEVSGWESETSSLLEFEDLPQNAKEYIDIIENTLEVPVSHISTGPFRHQMIKKCK